MILEEGKFYTHPKMLDCMIWIRAITTDCAYKPYYNVTWFTRKGRFIAADGFNIPNPDEWREV